MGEVGQRMLGEVWNELLLIACQSLNLTSPPFSSWVLGDCNHCSFVYLWMHLLATQVVPQIPYLPLSNRTLFGFGLSQRPQDYHRPLHMLLPAVTIDDCIIQVGGSICSMVLVQHMVHQPLESGWGPPNNPSKVSQTVLNWYNPWLNPVL